MHTISSKLSFYDVHMWIMSNGIEKYTITSNGRYGIDKNLPIKLNIPIIAISKDKGDGVQPVSCDVNSTRVRLFFYPQTLYFDILIVGKM